MRFNRPGALPARRAAIFATLAFALSLAPRPAPAEPRPPSDGKDIRKTTIAEGVYQFTTIRDAYVRQLNSVVIVNESDVVVFDTNTRPSSARLILAEIRKITDKPVRTVINSHWHPDHWSGNGVFAEAFPGLDIIATQHTRQVMLDIAGLWPAKFKGELARSQEALAKAVSTGRNGDGSPVTAESRLQDEQDVRNYATFVDESTSLQRTYPTLVYVDALTLFRGRRELRLMSVTGDAEGTTALYLPKEKILVTGDAVSYPIPYFTPPPTRQAQSLRALAQLDVEVVIPGHGPAFKGKGFLHLELELLETVIQGVREALGRGASTLEAIQREVTAEALRERFTQGDEELDARYRERVKVLVKLAVREAKDGQDL